MIDRAVVNFEETFGKGKFLGVEPKMIPEDKNNPNGKKVQARDDDTGMLKWTATIAVKLLSKPNAKLENITITLSSKEQPYGSIPDGTPVIVEGLEMGVMKQDRGGFSTFFSAQNIRPVAPERAATGQSLQPLRATSGQ